MTAHLRSTAMFLAIGVLFAFQVQPAQAAEINSANTTSAAVEKIEPAVTAFENTFSTLSGCLGSPTIIFENLQGRKGEYRVGTSTIAINPNRSIDDMPAVVVHELGHHLFIECSIDRDSQFRESFYAAQGITDTRSWYDSSAGWAATPAEQFSEAVALYVLGAKGSSMAISDEALDLIAAIGRPDSDTTRTPITANTAMRRSSQDGTNLSHATLVAAVQTPQPTAEVGPERTSSQSAPTPVSAWVASQVRLVIWRIAQ